jgi:ATP-dependent HslUV protease subunit HslV
MTSQFDPHSTTILAVRRDGRLALGGDGQVTLGTTVMKGRPCCGSCMTAVPVGFAGGTADASPERFEGKRRSPHLTRAAIELAGTAPDRYLRRLEALLVVGDTESLYVISGNGDDRAGSAAAAIGPVAPAQPAARALFENTPLGARDIVERSLGIAADICIYTNRNLTIEELGK